MDGWVEDMIRVVNIGHGCREGQCHSWLIKRSRGWRDTEKVFVGLG